MDGGGALGPCLRRSADIWAVLSRSVVVDFGAVADGDDHDAKDPFFQAAEEAVVADTVAP